MSPVALQAFGFVGALCILIAYVALQFKKMDSTSITYNVLNAVGAGILLYVAFFPFQLGFVVMEGTWTLVSLYALFKLLRHRTR